MASKEDMKKKVKGEGIEQIQLQFSDVDGFEKATRVPAKELDDLFDNGSWFDGSSIEGFARIYESDKWLKPDFNTLQVLPWTDKEGKRKTARIISDVHNADGSRFEGDPRVVLRKNMEQIEKEGYKFKTGPEPEFYLFGRDNEGNLMRFDESGYFDPNMGEKIRDEISDYMEKMGIKPEMDHHEVGPGQYEMDFEYSDALTTADNVQTFKSIVKNVAYENGLVATFMPKPIGSQNGSGMHVHQSLFDKNGNNLFYSKNSKDKLSKVAKGFIGGQLDHIHGITPVLNPLVNSYKRLVPGYEAPVIPSWGSTNRSALIRVPRVHKGQPKATRVEIRSPDPSANAYLAFSAMLKAGMDGIYNKSNHKNYHMDDDVYDQKTREEFMKENRVKYLPNSLDKAIEEAENDPLVKEALGGHAFNSFIESRKKDWDAYIGNHVTEHEIKSYAFRY